MDPRIGQIVVPLDGSELAATALGPARALAAATGASLRLVTTRWGHDTERPREYLKGLAARLASEHVDTVVIMDRDAVDAILLEAHPSSTLVCMATHGRGGMGHAVLGSVAESVLGKSEHPLLLVGPRLQTCLSALEPPNLLVAVDGSEISETIVPTAADWAQTLGLSVHVVEVILPPAGLTLPRHEQQAADYVAGLVARLRAVGVVADGEVLHGAEPADLILDSAGRLPVTLIAVATHGRTGLARVALGSTAMRVVHHSPCPVLVARPARLND